VVLLAAGLLFIGGCSRAFYRTQADNEVDWLIREKAVSTQTPLAEFNIDIDSRSRMHDSANPDCNPLPPDDPASHRLMHCVDCKKGYPAWHAFGDRQRVASPYWMADLPGGENGTVELNQHGAVRLALLHSPNYQQELETLYLSALDVTLERFAFDTQYFGGFAVDYRADGPERRGAGGESSSRLATSLNSNGPRPLGFSRTFATGGQLIVGLANSLVWEFSGPDTQVVTTLADFALVQPLLRAAGRDRILESLTQSERTLLANVRSLERYRRGYFLEIVTGRSAGAGVTRNGNGISTANVNSSLGSVNGFFGLVQTLQNLRNQETTVAGLRAALREFEEFAKLGQIDAIQVQQARQALFNAQSRLLVSETNFRVALDRYKVTLGLPPELDVKIDDDEFDRFALLDLATLAQQYRINDLAATVGESIEGARGFDPTANADAAEQRCEFESDREADRGRLPSLAPPGDRVPTLPLFNPIALQDEGLPTVPLRGDALRGVDDPCEGTPEIEWNENLAKYLRELLAHVKATEKIRTELLECNLVRAREDLKDLDKAIPDRLAQIKILARRPARRSYASDVVDCGPEISNTGIASELYDPTDLKLAPAELKQAVDCVADKLTTHANSIQKRTSALEKEIEQLLKIGPQLSAKELGIRLEGNSTCDANRESDGHEDYLEGGVFVQLPQTIRDLRDTIKDLLIAQVRARSESVTLTMIDLKPAVAIEIARQHRRDWMNTRAALVDIWRQIEFTADDLESSLDLVFNGDIQNVGDEPFSFQGTTGRLQVGLQFDAPLNRMAERNTYREALINYQQARRDYYQFEDTVAQGLREIIYNLEVNQVNFEIRRRAVRSAIEQFELAQNVEPPSPDQSRGGLTSPPRLPATTARNLVAALSDLQSAQNDFFGVYLSYESFRRSLDYDLGVMQLTSEGIWIDPGEAIGQYPLPPGSPCAGAQPLKYPSSIDGMPIQQENAVEQELTQPDPLPEELPIPKSEPTPALVPDPAR